MANSNNNSQSLLDPVLFGTPQTIESVLSEAGVAAGGAGDAGTSQITETLSQLNQQMLQLQTVGEAQTQATTNNTQAVDQNTTQHTQSGSSTAGNIGQTLSSFFGIGSALSPLISGIVSLFGGDGGPSEPAALTQYIPPSRVNVSAGVSDSSPGQAFGVDYAQGGQPRPVDSGAAPSGATQITVQVQAMDSQSFLDHSNDIALAVRQAMLESSVLNDVIREV
jgi:ElaB/YqjD/DUF883 family membrane-anchored ribosome-binding protein